MSAKVGNEKDGVSVKVKSGSNLEVFDANNDGVVDEQELETAVKDSIRDKELNKLFKNIIYSLVVLVIVLVGSLTFMTVMVVELSKGIH